MKRRDFLGTAALTAAGLVATFFSRGLFAKEEPKQPKPKKRRGDHDGWTHLKLVKFFETQIRTWETDKLYNYRTRTFEDANGRKDGGFQYTFTADKCSCGLTANIPHGPGWFCECGHYNTLPYSHYQICHKRPDLGPTNIAIRKAAGVVLKRHGVRGRTWSSATE